MLGVEDRKPGMTGNRIRPVQVTGNLSVMSMGFLLPDASSPVIWRGPVKMGAIRQFLDEVEWGALDYLVVDLPPGTGDEALSIGQLAPNIAGAVIVTTPQDVAVLDATKAVTFIQMMEITVLGIIENMSGMVCPHCGQAIELFGQGGGQKAAESLGVMYLGAIPLDPAMVKAGDEGRPFAAGSTGSPAAKAIDSVLENLLVVAELES
jgi:ATP-binding protein involved in chromosome partitioning